MVMGIAGGIIMGGMIAAAIMGDVIIMLVAIAAGFTIAGCTQLVKTVDERRAMHSKLAKYPSYKY